MGAGLIILVAGSKERNFLTKNPEITFFKIVYKKHTNFSIETVPQYFVNPIDFGRQGTLAIGKNGDLVHKIYLHLDLPNLPKNSSTLPNYTIRYVENLGFALISKVEVEIGGIVISKHYGEWMYIWKELTTPKSQLRGLDRMIGNDLLFNKEENSKPSLSLDIPLYFWFCLGTGNSLPIVSINQENIKIHFELRNLSEVVIQSPQKYLEVEEKFTLLEKGERFYQNVDGNKKAGEFVEFDIVNQRLYYNPIYGEIEIPTTSSNTYNLTSERGYTHQLKTGKETPVEVVDFFNLDYPSLINAYCLVEYIFLDNEERNLYLTRNHEYLINNLQTINEEQIFSNNVKLNLPISHPVSGIYWRVLLENNYQNKDYFNYSKVPFNVNLPIRGFNYQSKVLPKDFGYVNPYSKQQLLIEEEREFERNNLVKNIKLILNGQPLSNLEQPEYFNLIQRGDYFRGRGNEEIYHHIFSINPTDYHQPYGSLNFSKLDDSYLQLTLDGIIDYENSARIKGYILNYNIFRIIDGVGNLVFSN